MPRNQLLLRFLSDANTDEADRGLPYAVLTHIEQRLDVGALVKYGDARAVKSNYGYADPVWDATPDSDECLLFRVEPTDGAFSADDIEAINLAFVTIGACFVGTAGHAGHHSDTHWHYVWPKDHPVTDLLDAE